MIHVQKISDQGWKKNTFDLDNEFEQRESFEVGITLAHAQHIQHSSRLNLLRACLPSTLSLINVPFRCCLHLLVATPSCVQALFDAKCLGFLQPWWYEYDHGEGMNHGVCVLSGVRSEQVVFCGAGILRRVSCFLWGRSHEKCVRGYVELSEKGVRGLT